MGNRIAKIGYVITSIKDGVSLDRKESIIKLIKTFFEGKETKMARLSSSDALSENLDRKASEIIWFVKLLVAQIILETRWMESEQWEKTGTAGVIARPGVTIASWVSDTTLGVLFPKAERELWFTGDTVKVYKNRYFTAQSKDVGVKMLTAYLTTMRKDFGSTVKKRMSDPFLKEVESLESKFNEGVLTSELNEREFRILVKTNIMRWQSGADPQKYLSTIESIANNNLKISII